MMYLVLVAITNVLDLTTSPHGDPMVLGLDPPTMPHALINNRNGTFTFTKLDKLVRVVLKTIKKQRVGDDTSNPFPTLVLLYKKCFFTETD